MVSVQYPGCLQTVQKTSNHLFFKMVCHLMVSVQYPGYLQTVCSVFQTILFLNGLSPWFWFNIQDDKPCIGHQTIWFVNGFSPDGFGSISRIFANCAKDIRPADSGQWFRTVRCVGLNPESNVNTIIIYISLFSLFF
jgi:hypothetical protein